MYTEFFLQSLQAVHFLILNYEENTNFVQLQRIQFLIRLNFNYVYIFEKQLVKEANRQQSTPV